MGKVLLKIRNDTVNRFDLNKGEAIEYNRNDKTKGLIIACPQCGYPASGPHEYDPETQTLKPSLICGAEGCNYHGHLKNRYFDKVK